MNELGKSHHSIVIELKDELIIQLNTYVGHAATTFKPTLQRDLSTLEFNALDTSTLLTSENTPENLIPRKSFKSVEPVEAIKVKAAFVSVDTDINNDLDDVLTGLTSQLNDFIDVSYTPPPQKTRPSVPAIRLSLPKKALSEYSSKLGSSNNRSIKNNQLSNESDTQAGVRKPESVPLNGQVIQIAPVQNESKPLYKCTECTLIIEGTYVKIDESRVFHPEHFKCQGIKKTAERKHEPCGKILTAYNYAEHDSIFYCSSCYTEEFAAKCGYCHLPIKDKCINALGESFHSYHFFCAQCGKLFAADSEIKYMEHEGKAYCEEDYAAMFAHICGGCGLSLSGQYLNAIEKTWHAECLKCIKCRKSFNLSEKIYSHSGNPYCERHYFEKNGSICAGCDSAITGKCINALGKRYHENHFKCTYCAKDLSGTQFKGHDEKPYCIDCNSTINNTQSFLNENRKNHREMFTSKITSNGARIISQVAQVRKGSRKAAIASVLVSSLIASSLVASELKL